MKFAPRVIDELARCWDWDTIYHFSSHSVLAAIKCGERPHRESSRSNGDATNTTAGMKSKKTVTPLTYASAKVKAKAQTATSNDAGLFEWSDLVTVVPDEGRRGGWINLSHGYSGRNRCRNRGFVCADRGTMLAYKNFLAVQEWAGIEENNDVRRTKNGKTTTQNSCTGTWNTFSKCPMEQPPLIALHPRDNEEEQSEYKRVFDYFPIKAQIVHEQIFVAEKLLAFFKKEVLTRISENGNAVIHPTLIKLQILKDLVLAAENEFCEFVELETILVEKFKATFSSVSNNTFQMVNDHVLDRYVSQLRVFFGSDWFRLSLQKLKVEIVIIRNGVDPTIIGNDEVLISLIENKFETLEERVLVAEKEFYKIHNLKVTPIATSMEAKVAKAAPGKDLVPDGRAFVSSVKTHLPNSVSPMNDGLLMDDQSNDGSTTARSPSAATPRKTLLEKEEHNEHQVSHGNKEAKPASVKGGSTTLRFAINAFLKARDDIFPAEKEQTKRSPRVLPPPDRELKTIKKTKTKAVGTIPSTNVPSASIQTTKKSVRSIGDDSTVVKTDIQQMAESPTSVIPVDGLPINEHNECKDSDYGEDLAAATVLMTEGEQNLVDADKKIRDLEKAVEKANREKEQAEVARAALESQKLKMIGVLKKRKGVLIKADTELALIRQQLQEQSTKCLSIETESGTLHQGLKTVGAARDGLRSKLRVQANALRDAVAAKESTERELRRVTSGRKNERELLELYRNLASSTGYFKWGKQIRALEKDLAEASESDQS